MLQTLLLPGLLVWFPILFYNVYHRGFAVLLIWLLLAPVASNVINRPGANPLFQSPAEAAAREARQVRKGGYFFVRGDPVKLTQLLEPTRTLVGLFLVAFLLNGLVKKKRFAAIDRTELWMGSFSVILLTSVIFQSNVIGYSMRVASDGFIVGFLVYFIARRLVTTEGQLRELIRVVGYMGFSIIVICLIERLVHRGLLYRLSGPFRAYGTLHQVLMVPFFLALLDTLHAAGPPDGKHALHPGVRRVVLSMAPVVILLTWTRSNYLGFLLAVGLFLCLGQRLFERSQRMVTIAVALIVVSITMGLVAPWVTSNEVTNEIITRRIEDSGTVYGRLATWKVAVAEGMNNPILGVGLNNMRDVLFKKVERIDRVASFVSVHNSFLEIFAEQGLPGLVAYLAIAVSIIGMGLRMYRHGVHSRDRWRGLAVIALTVAYLIPAFYASVLHEPDPMKSIFLYAFLGGIAGLYGPRRQRRTNQYVGYAQPAKDPLVVPNPGG